MLASKRKGWEKSQFQQEKDFSFLAGFRLLQVPKISNAVTKTKI